MKTITAVMWFRDQATYDRFREICDSKEEFFASHAAWLRSSEKRIAALKRQGALIQKIEADPDEFLLWCKSTSRRLDGSARAEFAAMKAATGGHAKR